MATAQLGTLLRHIRKLGAPATDHQLLDAFSTRGDEAAFAELVGRHGPMVLRVCRRVLGHEQDAEDAFQATFLVLARHTTAIRKREAVAAWLHGVAYRTAMKARRTAARRRNHEAQLRQLPPRSASGPSWDEVQGVLDEEISRLAEPFRAAFVLCTLEGKTKAEAAGDLGCKEGTVSSRLMRARKLLQQRLSRRGIHLGAVLGALSATALSPALAQAAVRVGLQAGQKAGAIPASVAALTVEVGGALVSAKARVAAAVVIALGLCAAALTRQALATRSSEGAAAAPAPQPKAPPSPQAARDDKDEVTFRGRVLDPAGKPVVGAKIYLYYPAAPKVSAAAHATSDAEGRFRFGVRRAEFMRPGGEDTSGQAVPMAVAEGFGLGLPPLGAEGGFADKEVTLRLADDVPLDGRVLDLQGKPVAGATVRVRGIRVPRDGDLESFQDALQTHKAGYDVQNGMLAGLHNDGSGIDFDSLFAPIISDADGRFRLRGIGRERVADVLIEGPTIESKYVYALTRPGPRIEVPSHHKGLGPSVVMTHYGSSFDHVAPPSKPVVGVVRDKDTGKPIAGAVVKPYMLAGDSWETRLAFRAVTGKDGRYRITGMPRGKDGSLYVWPPDDQPYLAMIREAVETPGLEPVTVDFALKRGVWIDVRLTDKVTGKPVAGSIAYNVFLDNPHLKEFPGLLTPSGRHTNADDGRLRVAGLPGRGLIAVRAADTRYRVATGADKIKDRDNDVIHVTPSMVIPKHTHAVAEVKVPQGAGSFAVEVVLDPGRTLAGTVLDPDGKPLAGAQVNGLDEFAHWYSHWTPLATAQFTVTGLGSGRPRVVQFTHPAKGLAGFLVVQGDEKGPLRVTLGPAVTLTGRVVTHDGRPAVGGHIESINTDWFSGNHVFPTPADIGTFPRPQWTDKDGKFRIAGLAAGLKYNLYYNSGGFARRIIGPKSEDLSIKLGRTTDLGNVVVK
jgi:RNA polymerase sigma factor (sigma-70 family)